MTTSTTSLRRVVTFISGVAVGLFLLTGVASAAPSHDSSGGGNAAHSSSNPDNLEPQPASNADFSGNGANQHGAYDSTRDGSPSGNGNGKGQATGKPCAGCVGKADNKNPKGQAPDGSDHNAGYECDRNHGIGRSNPAHTGCTTSTGGDSTGSGSTTGGDVSGTDQGSTGGSTTTVDGGSSGSGSTPAVSAGDVTTANPADKPACAGGTMTTDVNGDGVVDSNDCAAVEGLTVSRAASVLGEAISRDPATAGGGRVVALAAGAVRGITTLASTGSSTLELVVAALLLLVVGSLLVRRSTGARR